MDAITLEVMRNRFFAITEEMGAALIRTAYSTNIKDRRDCSCALFDVNGETIAQAEHPFLHVLKIMSLKKNQKKMRVRL